MHAITQHIPHHQLPPGFIHSLREPGREPLRPLPAATLALLRQGGSGLEVLLLKRSRNTGFIPGAYVFPGGAVDEEDRAAMPEECLRGIDLKALETRMGVPAPVGFLVAALRETFEETGVLVGASVPDPGTLENLRQELMADRKNFFDVLTEIELPLRAGGIEYIGHWITPKPEARRYDTRFFAVEVPADTPVEIDDREMTEAIWLRPREALSRNEEGTLPLVFPTVVTLRELAAFESPAGALASYSDRPIPRCLPTLTETPDGIRIDLIPEFV